MSFLLPRTSHMFSSRFLPVRRDGLPRSLASQVFGKRKTRLRVLRNGPWAPLALTQRTLGARVFLFVFPMIPSAETKSLQLLLNLLDRFWVRGRDSDRLLVTSMMPNTNQAQTY